MAHVVTDQICILGEGPVWDEQRKSICWIDILQGEMHEYIPEENVFKTIPVHQMIGSFAICSDGHFIAAMKNGYGFINRDSGEVAMIADPERSIVGNRFNDGKCDPAGRFWAGTMSHTDVPEKGSLYVMGKTLDIQKKLENISISNGLAWSADHKTFYYIDSPTFRVVAFDYDLQTGEISNQRTVISVDEKEGSPDGMTIDREGMLWIAHWDGWQVSRWNPETGKKLQSFPLPVARVTSCCFGGEDYADLYITSARVGLSEKQLESQPLAGSLFVLKNTGFRGRPFFRFKKE